MAAITWAATVHSASHQQAVCSHLAEELGMQVRLAKVSYPRPGVMLLEGVELNDPETGQSVASMRLVEIDENANGQTLIISQPEINIAQAHSLWTLVEHRLHTSAGSNKNSLRLTAGELTLRWPGGVSTLIDSHVEFASTDTSSTLSATFRLANMPSAKPLQVQIERSLHSGQLADSMQLDATGAPLPCSLLCALLARENRLGTSSTLRGTIQASETPDGLQADFSGRLEQIDLSTAITDQFPHQLSGPADLAVKHALIHAGRLEQFEGRIQAGPGVISPSLLAAAADTLGMQRGFAENSQSGAAGGAIPYEALSADVRLDPNGLTIHGRCGGDTGIVLRSKKEGALLKESAAGPVPMVALIKMLVPDSRVQVPATRQTDWLLNVLPIPDVVPHDLQSLPQARLHGRELR